jgi:predicted ferric reductase
MPSMLRSLFTHRLRHPSHRGLLVVIASLLISYGLWLGSLAWHGDWYDDPWKYPAKVGSHGATLLMCWAFILATRFRPVEWLFGGLDKVYQAHRHIGEVAFVLIWLHPLGLAAHRWSEGLGAYLGYFSPWADAARASGVAALLGFVVLVTLSLLSRIPYHRWKHTHDFFGPLLMLVVLHAVWAEGEIMRYPILQAWFGLWCGLGLAAYLYIRIFYRWLGPQYDYRITAVTPVGNDITELSFKPTGRAMRHRPGQFLYVSFDADAISREPHPFTIASPPEAPELRLAIKSLGDWTSQVSALRPGEPARLWGPYGHLADALWEEPDHDVILLAGGIGITPFLSIIASAAFAQRPGRAWLVYSVQSRDKAVFTDELRARAEALPQMTLLEHIADDEGYITRAWLEQRVGPLARQHALLCGPGPMNRAMSQLLREAGVPLDHIHLEVFQIR